jgi:hypothetical protein
VSSRVEGKSSVRRDVHDEIPFANSGRRWCATTSVYGSTIELLSHLRPRHLGDAKLADTAKEGTRSLESHCRLDGTKKSLGFGE